MKTSGTRRAVRLADQIMRELSVILTQESADPRLTMVNITAVRMNSDLTVAEVLYTVWGSAEEKSGVSKALAAAASYLRGHIGRRLKLKYVPELRFSPDTYLEKMVYDRAGE